MHLHIKQAILEQLERVLLKNGKQLSPETKLAQRMLGYTREGRPIPKFHSSSTLQRKTILGI